MSNAHPGNPKNLSCRPHAGTEGTRGMRGPGRVCISFAYHKGRFSVKREQGVYHFQSLLREMFSRMMK